MRVRATGGKPGHGGGPIVGGGGVVCLAEAGRMDWVELGSLKVSLGEEMPGGT